MRTISLGAERVVAFPDLHAPFTDMVAFERALKIASDYKPTVIVLLGDTLDCLALSGYTHPQDAARADDWVSEVEKSVPIYRKIQALAKRTKARVIELEGNHEERRTRARNVPVQFQRALDIERVCPELQKIRRSAGWTVHPYTRADGLLHIGGLVAMHGFGHGVTGGEKDALRARQSLARLGRVYPEVVVVRGHQHALVPFHGGGPLPVRCRGIQIGVSWCSPGTMGPSSCSWDPNINDSEWGPGIFLGATDKHGCVTDARVVCLR
jgi:predicted phosphodiesterase